MKWLKYVFSALLILAVWGLWWWLDLATLLAILATATILVVLLAVVVWVIVADRRAAAKIEAALTKQGGGASPDREAEVQAMSAEFRKAVIALERSSLGRNALYALPWYVIIGPPGVGKSTALRHSGLQFPHQTERGGVSVKGIGGTRNCDWWMTNQAVIVDTAGRYTTEDSDREEWLAFLDLLRDNRPKRPINGILLAVSVADLALAHERDIGAMAGKIRARIDEVTRHLQMSVPIYVLFTKCDLLPGFMETYTELGKTERQQIWGFTLAVRGPRVGDPISSFCEQFDRLADRTEQRAFTRLGVERRIDARGRIYQFPHEFELLRDNLASFIGQVFTANVYAETPMLRGCYFTSGTQTGRPIDRLLGAMAKEFGSRDPALLGPQQLEPRSYFVGNLFSKVIFADRELARRSLAHLRRAQLLESVAAIGVFAVAIGLCVLPIRSLRANQAVLAELGSEVERLATSGQQGIVVLDRLAPLHEAITELHGFEYEARPIRMRWGMYQGDVLDPAARALFGRVVRAELIVPLLAEHTDDLRNFASRYPNDHEPPADESSDAFDRLRAYLLLTGDYAEDRPEPSAEQLVELRAREDEWLAEHLAQNWASVQMLDTTGPAHAQMLAITQTYVAVMREQPELALDRDRQMVGAVQEVLVRNDRTEAWLTDLISAAAELDGVKDLTLASMKLGTNVYTNDGARIRGAFTRQGWEKHARAYLAGSPGDFVGTEWVIGLNDSQARERQLTDRLRLRSRYFDQYIKEWDHFVAKIYVEEPDDLVGSLTMFQELARGGSPLRTLIDHVNWHTKLDELPHEAGDLPWYHAEMLPAKEVDQPYYENRDVRLHFEPFVQFGVDVESDINPNEGPPQPTGALPIDAYQERLTLVRDALQAAVDDHDERESLAKQLDTATQFIKGQVSEQEEPWRSRFDRILRPPFDAVRGVVEHEQGAGIGSSWCSAVYQPFAEQVAGKYPFDPKGYDLPLGEFAAWFAPEQGPVWSFYTASLGVRVERNGNVFTIVDPGANSTITYNRQLPAFLSQFADIGTVMFPPGTPSTTIPKFEFEIQIDGTPGISEITLNVDGQKLSYRNGPQEWTSLTWPAAGDPGASIRAKGLGKNGDVIRKGEWGLWRLLAEATVTGSAGQQVYTIKWDLTDQQVGVITIRLRPKRSETPLFGVPARGTDNYLGLFASLRVPRAVASGYVCTELDVNGVPNDPESGGAE